MTTILTDGDKAVIRNIVGRIHVSCADMDVHLELCDRIKEASPKQLREALRYGLSVHHQNQALHRRVTRGGF